MVWPVLKKRWGGSVKSSDWIVSAADVKRIVFEMEPLLLPEQRPKRVILMLPTIPAAYFCIPSIANWYYDFCEQVTQYASHLELMYDFEFTVIVKQ